MLGKWIRPAHVPFPSVWHRFKGRKEINGIKPNYWVQDIPEELYDDVVENWVKYLIEEEPISKFSKGILDPLFVEDLRYGWSECLKSKLALACFMENPDPKGKPIMVGMNLTFVTHKDDEMPKLRSEKLVNILSTHDYVTKLNDPFKYFNVNQYLNAMGLITHPEYRGNGLGLEILKAREAVCKAFGLKVTVTSFTSIFSQTIATKCGFKVLSEMDYEELERVNPKFRFPGIENHTKALKIMYWEF